MNIIELKDIKKTYNQGLKEVLVLKGLSLDLEEGKSLSIVGQSGSGKSTLLSILSGIENADEGGYLLDSDNFFEMNEDDKVKLRSNKIGIIFQQFHLLPHMTALENVLLPLEILGRNDGVKEAKELLGKIGLADRLDHFPDELSGGEKQRVAIARAMIIKPKLILADEPSGSLDEKTGEDIMNLIFSLVQEEKTSLILVTHNNSLAQLCDKTLKLEHGLLI
jgi:putative ABC transport system ATP-binding protein